MKIDTLNNAAEEAQADLDKASETVTELEATKAEVQARYAETKEEKDEKELERLASRIQEAKEAEAKARSKATAAKGELERALARPTSSHVIPKEARDFPDVKKLLEHRDKMKELIKRCCGGSQAQKAMLQRSLAALDTATNTAAVAAWRKRGSKK